MAGISLSYDPPGEVLRAFCRSPAAVRALIGPLWAGRKTTVVRGEILRRAYAVGGRWRWTILAPAAELETVIACWRRWAPLPGDWDKAEEWNRLKFAVELPGLTDSGAGKRNIDLELRFLARGSVKDIGAALGETTGVWLAGARDLDEACFDAALVAAGSWPLDDKPRPFVICTSRMPAAGHWLAQRPELSADGALFRQPGGRAPDAENLKHLKPGFYPRLAEGRPADWVRVNIDAEFAAHPVLTREAAEARETVRGRLARLAEALASVRQPEVIEQQTMERAIL